MSEKASVFQQEKPAVRLRRPERSQMEWVAGCVDDLVEAEHPVRRVMAVVETLDMSDFYEPIQARAGMAGRDATDPRLLVALWLYGCIDGVGSARELDRLCRESSPYRWLCGGVTVNYHLLSDFRTGHGSALDALFTSVIVALVDKDVVQVSRISQDGTRVRVSAGASSFRREERLRELLSKAKAHVEEVKRELEDPEVSPRQRAARARAARERQERLEAAIAELPELQRRQAEAEKKAGNGKQGEKIRRKEVRVSTTDPEARRMKMANGGFNPAMNVQLTTDTESRAIVGVDVTNEGSDAMGLSEPMREQVERRSGDKVEQHLMDGGYLRTEDIERAQAQGVDLYVPPKTARSEKNRDHELEPKRGDSAAILAWKSRMSSEGGKKIYKQRAATIETVNADLKTYRGLGQLTVRGLAKARCVAMWCALAYNVMHFGEVLLR